MHAESKRQRFLHIVGERKGIFIIAFQMAVLASIVGTGLVFAEEEDEKSFVLQDAYTHKTQPQNTKRETTYTTFENINPQPTQTPTPTPTPLEPEGDESEKGETVENDDVWERLADCESGGNWEIDTGNGYYGGLQFSQSAWESVGGDGNPADTSKEEQIERGKALQQSQGWSAWGLCAKQLGLN